LLTACNAMVGVHATVSLSTAVAVLSFASGKRTWGGRASGVADWFRLAFMQGSN